MQRACLIYSDIEIGIYDMTDTSYNRELWLLEDMSFALVHNVSMVIKSGDFYYATEYRSIVKLLKERDDLFFTPESLTEELEEMCIPQWENQKNTDFSRNDSERTWNYDGVRLEWGYSHCPV